MSVVLAQNTEIPGNGDLNLPDGYVWADVLTDGRTRITFGDITADTLSLTDRLQAGDSALRNLMVTSLEVANLMASSINADSLQTKGLNVWNPAMLEGDATISGNLHAGQSSFMSTRTSSLMVQGEAHVMGTVFAQKDALVGGDLNVGGAGRFMGPASGDTSLKVEDMLTVTGSAAASDWYVKGYTETQYLQAGATSTHNLWATNVNVTGTLNVTGDVQGSRNLQAGKMVNAKTLNTSSAVTTGANTTVSGWLSGQSATVTGNAALSGWETIHGSLTVQGSGTTRQNFTTGMTLAAVGNITSRTVEGMDAIFTNLNVDTGTIQTLTSTFVTATTLHAQDATATGTFVGQGASTLNTLNVIGASAFNGVNFVSLDTDDLSSPDVTSERLNNTVSAVLTTVEVATSLAVGANPAFGYYATFQDVFIDNLTAVDLWGAQGTITTMSGDSLDYHNITGKTGTLTSYSSTNATIGVATINKADIHTLMGLWANFTYVDASAVDTMNVTSEDADLMNLHDEKLWAKRLTVADIATIDNITAGYMETTTFQASTWGHFTDLYSEDATVTSLTSTNATITTLTSTDATTQMEWSKNVTYMSGTITNIWSDKHYSKTALLNGFDAGILYANTYANITDTEAQTLKVTETSWIKGDARVMTELSVEGFSTLSMGIIAGDSVIAALTVVGDTLTSSVDVTGPAFLTDMSVKKMTITDEFHSTTSSITTTTAQTLTTSGNFTVGGVFNVTGDSRLGGNLVVQGTTQFQTGSFSRIGTAILTTTDMEAFNINVASGLFGGLTVDDLTINKAAKFDRSIALVKMLASNTDAPYSVFSSILPSTLHGTEGGVTIAIQAATVLHTGQSTVDALVFTASNDSTMATLRITGDGYMDFMGGELDFESLEINGGILFENENNAAWARGDAVPSTNLVRGATAPFYVYNDLIDRDLVPPGVFYDPTRFAQPSDSAQQDLLTLFGGHYRVSGNVYFVLNSAATANARVIARAGVSAYIGTQSSGSASWTTDCMANFQVVAGATYGGSCFFDGIVIVDEASVMTLRTFAQWSFASATLGNTLRVDPSSTILVEELFTRTSEIH